MGADFKVVEQSTVDFPESGMNEEKITANKYEEGEDDSGYSN